jgi:hypothetical protein
MLAHIGRKVRARIMAKGHIQRSDLQMTLVAKWKLFSCL